MQPDRDLERELRELGSRVEYPPTPDLARAVRRRLEEAEQPAPRRGWFDLPVVRWAAGNGGRGPIGGNQLAPIASSTAKTTIQ